MDELTAARAARDAAAAHLTETRAELRAAGIRAKNAIDELHGTLRAIARQAAMTPSTLSKLNPRRSDVVWAPLGIEAYRAIDAITGGRFRLADLREKVDEAGRRLKRAESAVSLAEARTDGTDAARTASAGTRAQDGMLVIDDVQVDRRFDRVVLDVKVRNDGARPANITRAAVTILRREEFLAAYPASADYDLLVDGDHNEVGVAHFVGPDDVDRFTLTLGFAASELGCVFTAQLALRVNRDHVAVSESFTFNSCFE